MTIRSDPSMSSHLHLTQPIRTAPSSIRGFLKLSTRTAHNRVEARYSAIFGVDEPAYGRYLRVTARAVFALEQLLAQGWKRPIGDWPLRARSLALADDLALMGIGEPAVGVVPDRGGEAFRLGILYVLEGSRHGARQLARAALASPAPAVRNATRFLRHGEGQRLWSSFVDHLEASSAVREDPCEAARGAEAAFSVFDEAAELRT